MDAWEITFKRCDPGKTVKENSWNVKDPDSDIVEANCLDNFSGTCRTTKAHLQNVLILLQKLNLGYATNLAACETAISAVSP